MQNPLNLLHFSRHQTLPMVMQSEMGECGVACLTMVANYYGDRSDINRVREKVNASGKGLRLSDVIDAAGRLQLNARPLRLDLEHLQALKTPAILHWNLDHYVVLKSVKSSSVVVHDPALGVRTLRMDQVSDHFSGIALELLPSPGFETHKPPKRARLTDFWRRIAGVKRTLMQIFMLSLLMQLLTLASPLYLQLAVDNVTVSRDMDFLWVLAMGFGLMTLVAVLIKAMRGLVILFMGAQLNIQIGSNLYSHLLKLPMSYFEKRHMGDITSRFGSLHNLRDLLTTGLVEAIVDGFMALGLLVMLFIYSVKLALIVCAVMTLYALFRLMLYRVNKQMNENVIVAEAKQQSNFMETVRAIQTVKLFGHESQRQVLWQNHYADSLNASLRVGQLNVGYNLINGLLFGIENILVIYLAVLAVVNDQLTVGMLFAFMTYKMQLTQRASTLIEKMIQFKMLALHLERLGDITLTKTEAHIESTSGPRSLQGSLQLKDIAFSYSDSSPALFEQVSLSINPGESVAIVGPSGEGKTTLMKIMLGLLQPSEGVVRCDGIDIKKMGLKAYRQCVGAVMQDDVLLSGNIRDNIAFFTAEVDQEKVDSCARMAAIYEDIMAMPMGFHTLVGDMGSGLSGGQVQRLLLARSLYKSPRMLFLDEATSHLDETTESQVNAMLKRLKISRIMIAHRPSTIQQADRVFLLRNRRLLEITGQMASKQTPEQKIAL